MTSESRPLAEIWNTLSPQAKELCVMVKIPGDENVLRETFIEEDGYNLEAMLQEVRTAGVVEVTTMLREAQKIVEKFQPTRDLAGPTVVFTEEERTWHKAKSQIERYERGHTAGDPKAELFTRPQLKVKDEFQPFVPDL